MNPSALFKKPLVGLDIGISGIKALEVSSPSKPKIVAYNRIPFPIDTITADGEFKNRSLVVLGLKKLFERNRFSSKRVAVNAFGNKVLTKRITVPKMSENELLNQLYFEAEQYIPFNISEVNVDFVILGRNLQTQAESPMMDVLIVAAKKDAIQNTVSILEEAGLKACMIDNPAFALGNAFEFNYKKQMGNASCAVIDFGAGSTKISIVEKEKTVFSRELRQSGNTCTEMLSDRLGIGLEQAEKMKIEESSTPTLKPIVQEFVGLLVDEIARSLDFWAGQSNGNHLQAAFYCGGGSLLEGLCSTLESKLSFPLKPFNGLLQVPDTSKSLTPKMIQEIKTIGQVSLGLALRHVGDKK